MWSYCWSEFPKHRITCARLRPPYHTSPSPTPKNIVMIVISLQQRNLRMTILATAKNNSKQLSIPLILTNDDPFRATRAELNVPRSDAPRRNVSRAAPRQPQRRHRSSPPSSFLRPASCPSNFGFRTSDFLPTFVLYTRRRVLSLQGLREQHAAAPRFKMVPLTLALALPSGEVQRSR